MSAGQLRHRVTFVKKSSVKNAIGGTSTAFETVATLWANIKPGSASENVESDKHTSEISHTVRIRYNPNINAAFFIQYQGRTFQVEAVINENERDRYMLCECVELT
ncbi:phage head closure protein [Litoribrevibacter albus]|uniref:Head-tail adaptor protein n=1 Tax=Litoribrevibacter albus TaxID=1473156 RepID=A0AA37W8L8_9GAMM|nr:phage head closure protein [Litoribrevibacter albus]GLQ31661.1 hypothetical protein GCM10007876_21400 [Litoribrevibacter albus]